MQIFRIALRIRHEKHLACVEVTLLLFPDVIFHLTPNYRPLPCER